MPQLPFPVPGHHPATAVAAPRGSSGQRWAGAPSAALDHDGSVVLAYRVREGGSDHVVLARSADGVVLDHVAELHPAAMGAAMTEKACLVRLPDRWRAYVSCATPGGPHWWVGLLEARRLEDLAHATVQPVLPGDPARTGLKDPVVRATPDGFEAWLCAHDLTVAGEEDRMSTLHATSGDGVRWTVDPRPVLTGTPGRWDARGARVTAVLDDGRVAYDGRASATENWFERCGLAVPTKDGLRPDPAEPVADLRYLEVLALADGSHRLWYEARRPDGAHELRTELVPAEPTSRPRGIPRASSVTGRRVP
jgi:hypothetical protein